MQNEALFTYTSGEWETQSDLFELLNYEFHFTLDPACTEKNKKCNKYFTKEKDGLSQDWGNEIVFLNPPYGRGVDKWIEKSYNESVFNGATTVCLLPSRTDVSWWHKYVRMAYEIRFLKGRLKFGHNTHSANNSATFPSAIIVFKRGRGDFPIVKFWDWKKDYKELLDK